MARDITLSPPAGGKNKEPGKARLLPPAAGPTGPLSGPLGRRLDPPQPTQVLQKVGEAD
jgi:hypothetical protein